MVPLGTPVPDFNLKGIDGREYSQASYADKKVLVVVFMCNHCPYVQKIWDDLVALEKRLPEEVQFLGINPNGANPNYPEDSFEKMKEYAAAKGQEFPYLLDETQEVARAYGAVCTPDIYVYDANRRLYYHGRINDNWQNPQKVEKEELKEAIDDLLDGSPPPHTQHPSLGCSIKWKETR